jgi:microcystin-dependent protein
MADQFVGEIRVFPFTFAPTGWALCNGQLLPISQNTALFSLLGTTYGGDGRSTFGLPDLRGRAPLHPGQGPGLTPRQLGEMGGAESVVLTESQLPAHTHDVRVAGANDASSATPTPSGLTTFGVSQARATSTGYVTVAGQAAVAMSPAAVLPSGQSLAHNNMPPFLTFNFCIALQGIFPPRS